MSIIIYGIRMVLIKFCIWIVIVGNVYKVLIMFFLISNFLEVCVLGYVENERVVLNMKW